MVGLFHSADMVSSHALSVHDRRVWFVTTFDSQWAMTAVARGTNSARRHDRNAATIAGLAMAISTFGVCT